MIKKGIILCGGLGSRLFPVTKYCNKHLLPVYDKPMLLHAVDNLVGSGIRNILFVINDRNVINLIANGEDYGCNATYRWQKKPKGIADALSLAEDWANGEDIAVLLGDNIFENYFDKALNNFESGATIFLYGHPKPHQYGVVELKNNKIVSIVEKPTLPKSNLIATGLYLYDHRVFNLIKQLEPSQRNELEITDLNNIYLKFNQLNYELVEGRWIDCGENWDTLLEAGNIVKELNAYNNR